VEELGEADAHMTRPNEGLVKWIGILLRIGSLISAILVSVRSGHAQPSPGSGSGPWLLNVWSLSDTNWAGGYDDGPLAFTNLECVQGSPAGNYLLLDTSNTVPSFLFYSILTPKGGTNLNCFNGSISVWFNPDWSSTNQPGGTGPGDWANLLSVGQWGTNDSSWWGWFISPDGATLSLAGQTNDDSPQVYASAPISLVSNTWYNLVCTYDPTNSFLYTNGVLLTNGGGVTAWPGPDVTFFAVGSDTNGYGQARGMFSDLATYEGQLDSNSIAGWFTINSIFYGWTNTATSLGIPAAPSSPSTSPGIPDAISGPGLLQFVSTNSSGVTSSNVWITNVSATLFGGGATLSFTIAGGSNNLAYDVFATPMIASPITNAVWSWMGQGYHSCTYNLTIQSNRCAFLILGTPLDSATNNLTDAYQLLITHTDPYIYDQDGSGLSDGWQVLLGLNPLTNQVAQPTTRVNYGYTPADWLTNISGVKSGTVSLDNEGNVLSVSQ
jgi:hypothetical protein